MRPGDQPKTNAKYTGNVRTGLDFLSLVLVVKQYILVNGHGLHRSNTKKVVLQFVDGTLKRQLEVMLEDLDKVWDVLAWVAIATDIITMRERYKAVLNNTSGREIEPTVYIQSKLLTCETFVEGKGSLADFDDQNHG